VNFPATPKKALPPEANTPVLIQRILDVTTLEDLRSMLDNPIHTPIQQSCLYAEIRKRRDLPIFYSGGAFIYPRVKSAARVSRRPYLIRRLLKR
jgi:hypothetical protein